MVIVINVVSFISLIDYDNPDILEYVDTNFYLQSAIFEVRIQWNRRFQYLNVVSYSNPITLIESKYDLTQILLLSLIHFDTLAW